MPNWKKLLTSGSNIQISELTLDAAGVTKASIDTSGNLAAEGKISSSAALLGTEITLATNGTNKLVVSAAGAATFASTVTTTGILCPILSSNTDITYTADNDGNEVGQHIFKDRTAVLLTLDEEQASFAPSITSSSDISASGTLAGTALTLATAGVQKASITADGTGSFFGGITTGHAGTASLGYVTASQLIVQGTDQGAAIALYDNDGNAIAQFARCGSGANAHKGRIVLRDNATNKIELTTIGTSYVTADFSSSAELLGNTFQLAHNGTDTLDVDTSGNLSTTGIVNAGIGLIKHTIGSNKGDVVYFGGTTSMTTGDIYHYKSDGTWEKANCNAAATSDGLLAIALGAASDTNGMLLRGMATLAEIDGTEAVGDVLYLSEDATGHANVAAPEGNGDIARVIGYCLHASNKTIWFNPDSTFVEITA